MGDYRDDLAAARARIDALERDVADRDSEISRLKGTELVPVGDTSLAVPSKEKHSRWLGGPTELEFTRTWEASLSEEEMAELADHLRDNSDHVGTVSALPGSLTWSVNYPGMSPPSPMSIVRVTSRRGEVSIRATERLTGTAGIIYGVVGGSVGASLAATTAVPLSIIVSPLMGLVALPVLGATYLGCRGLFRSRARSRREKASRSFDDLCAFVDRILARPDRGDA